MLMNRNTNSRFSVAPQVDIQRSTFKRDSTVKTSFNVGNLIPFYLDEVLAGDTFKIKTSKVCRMQTLKTPMMDDLFIDTYYFFCPSRILWEHFVNFFGENSDSAWLPENEYTIPQIEAPEGGWNVGTVADYLGIPIGVDGISVNALPFRAVAKCYDEWFRDENLMDPLVIPTGDSTVVGSNGSNYITDVAKGGLPPVACKTHDYFTSCLPAPQKGPAVSLPLVGPGVLPVHTVGTLNEYYSDLVKSSDNAGVYKGKIRGSYPVLFEDYDVVMGDNKVAHPKAINFGALGDDLYYRVPFADMDGTTYNDINGLQGGISSGGVSGSTLVGQNLYGLHAAGVNSILPVNLVADGDNLLQYTTINDLRQAFQIQRYFEKCARGGTRFRELLEAHFGTSLGDVRAMIPEYLGGNRLNVNVRQITQTSSTTDSSPMGDVAGMSVTTDSHFDFEKSFTEPGYIIGFMVARYHHTYQQGIDPLFQRKGVFDFYWPSFAHLGEMPVRNRTIFAQGYDSTDPTAVDYDSQVFGYQEAWAEYRYKPNRVSGLMRSAASGSLDTWHFADYYSELPHLSADWIKEDKTNVDRVLTVSSAISDQIFADIYVENRTTRPMPLYSIPGLIDHF